MAKSRNPLVIAYHIMWTLYGWWLPNDPRGSTSQTIRNDLISELGELHFGRKRVQPAGTEIRTFQSQASQVLKYPMLSFAPPEFPIVAETIGNAISECKYTCYACAIMPDHLHLLIRKHRHQAEEMIENIQSLSRKRLVELELRELEHPTWTRGGWKVFLDHPHDVNRTIHYIDNNPLKIRLPRQQWGFVTTYDNWPLHARHSPNSPYARASRAAGRYPR